MSVALPWVLAFGVASAAIVGVLHLLSVRRPPTLLLPTARFVPHRDVRAVSRTRQPSDVLLLMLRVLALLCAAIAVAGVRCASGAASVGHVVVTDDGVATDTTALRRLVVGRDAGAPVAFASMPTRGAQRSRDGRASAALFPLAWRAAATMLAAEEQLDSVVLHVVSTHGPAVDDAAWRAWRATWPGRVVLHTREPADVDSGAAVRTARVRPTIRLVRPLEDMRLRANDVVASAFRAAGIAVDWADSTSAGATDSLATVVWPRNGIPEGWRAVIAADTSTTSATMISRALVVGGHALPYTWRASATPNDADSASALAWWSDDRVAAVERASTVTCRREIAVRVDESSDALLTPAAAAFLSQLAAPCVSRALELPAAFTRVTTDSVPSALASALRAQLGDAYRRPTDWWTPLLLAMSLMLVLLEWRLRSRASATAEVQAT